MIDEFRINIDNYNDIEIKLRELITNGIKNTNSVEFNISLNSSIDSLVKNMFEIIQNLERINSICLINKNKSIDEIAVRASEIAEIKANYKKLNEYINSSRKNKQTSITVTDEKKATEKDKLNMNFMVQDQRHLSEIVETQKKKQDVMINEFSSLVKKINNSNRQIEEELKNQLPIIKNVDIKTDNVNGNIKNTTSKLDVYLQKNSNCCLFSFIAVEILVILILVLG